MWHLGRKFAIMAAGARTGLKRPAGAPARHSRVGEAVGGREAPPQAAPTCGADRLRAEYQKRRK